MSDLIQKESILIVDDNPTNIKILFNVLQKVVIGWENEPRAIATSAFEGTESKIFKLLVGHCRSLTA